MPFSGIIMESNFYKARDLHNTYIVIASEAKQSITPCNHNRLPRRFAPRNDQKRSYANVSMYIVLHVGADALIGPLFVIFQLCSVSFLNSKLETRNLFLLLPKRKICKLCVNGPSRLQFTLKKG